MTAPPTLVRPRQAGTRWLPVCRVDDLLPERGACALVDGAQVAIFRDAAGDLFALSNHDPFSGAFVLSRGIVGSRGDQATVASPIGKQVFALATGVCLDSPEVRVPTVGVRAADGWIEVRADGGAPPPC